MAEDTNDWEYTQWEGGYSGAGKSAVWSNNNIEGGIFRRKVFKDGYAKRFGPWNRVILNPKEVEIPVVARKGEGAIFICGYIDGGASRTLQYYNGELEYDSATERFSSKWYTDTAWTLSDSIISRRISEKEEDVGETLVDPNWDASVYGMELEKTNKEIEFVSSPTSSLYLNIRRFEYQSLTKCSFDQESPYKRNTNYYNNIIKKLFEDVYIYSKTGYYGEDITTRLLDTYDSQLEEDVPTVKYCNTHNRYYFDNPSNVYSLNSKITGIPSILYDVNDVITTGVEDIENIFCHSESLDSYYAMPRKIITSAKKTSDLLATRYGDSYFIENVNFTKLEYDYRISYNLLESFFSISNENYTHYSNSLKNEEKKILYYGVDQNDTTKTLLLKDYASNNTIGYSSYFFLNFYRNYDDKSESSLKHYKNFNLKFKSYCLPNTSIFRNDDACVYTCEKVYTWRTTSTKTAAVGDNESTTKIETNFVTSTIKGFWDDVTYGDGLGKIVISDYDPTCTSFDETFVSSNTKYYAQNPFFTNSVNKYTTAYLDRKFYIPQTFYCKKVIHSKKTLSTYELPYYEGAIDTIYCKYVIVEYKEDTPYDLAHYYTDSVIGQTSDNLGYSYTVYDNLYDSHTKIVSDFSKIYSLWQLREKSSQIEIERNEDLKNLPPYDSGVFHSCLTEDKASKFSYSIFHLERIKGRPYRESDILIYNSLFKNLFYENFNISEDILNKKTLYSYAFREYTLGPYEYGDFNVFLEDKGTLSGSYKEGYQYVFDYKHNFEGSFSGLPKIKTERYHPDDSVDITTHYYGKDYHYKLEINAPRHALYYLNKEEKKIKYIKDTLPDYYLFTLQNSLGYDLSTFSFFLKSKAGNINLISKKPTPFVNSYYKVYSSIYSYWKTNVVTQFGCVPFEYKTKYFIFDCSNSNFPWEPRYNYQQQTNRFHNSVTAYDNYFIEGVNILRAKTSILFITVGKSDIEEGFSGIELFINNFTNLANGRCTTGYNVPCDTIMIGELDISENLDIINYSNIFSKDYDLGYTTNKGIMPVLKGFWQPPNEEGYSSQIENAIFGIETQCMIEGPCYYFSNSPDKLPPGFEPEYVGYKSRGLLISVCRGGTYNNHIIDGEASGFFNYFKPQNEKRHPVNARRAYDDAPQAMREEVGYYWDFEEAFGPYEISSPYAYETQLAGKMSFAVRLGYSTAVLFMFAYDIDKWPTSEEDTPTEYKHPEILPEEEYTFKTAFLTAELDGAEPVIPHAFKDFQMEKALWPLVERSKTYNTDKKLEEAGRKFAKDRETKKEYEGITIPGSPKDKDEKDEDGNLKGDTYNLSSVKPEEYLPQYEYDETQKILDEQKISRGVVRLVRWRTFTWREPKLDKDGNQVKKNKKSVFIEHRDAIAECAVSYTMDASEYVDLFYTGKDTVLLHFSKNDSSVKEENDKTDETVLYEICDGDTEIKNIRIPKNMCWQEDTSNEADNLAGTRKVDIHVYNLTKLGIFDILTIKEQSSSEEEEADPDKAPTLKDFEVITLPVTAKDAKTGEETTFYCVSKNGEDWEISGKIGAGFLSHTAAGTKLTEEQKENPVKDETKK